ncbi:hypothetical protein T310_5580 [Rasamsonia emersonii CBS 393.64]|uniref:Digeranylgeranylglyceryl phosphate synthase n=1 Tax=Rasamsonia emersonii (strain ATCC 16479 / CBS 393.64 / IMI 116815) TaxID=1408163 RepID=A0A0F4YRZ9_RASE3|nr:hypothetical protein T310_5580 [Rasamsonia emersonii CBS 393.64]KKA20393.1 hypothetical protein T310_5580 [Rasamsonia emersonii CBS 393.64]
MGIAKQTFPDFYSFARFVKLLWLFTADDVLSILIPNVVCSLAIALAGSPFESRISQIEVLARIPTVVLWVWLNLLFFNVSNQIQDASIEEDRENKPWRPLPSQAITQPQARILYAALGPLVLITSAVTGGILPSISLQILTFAYNDLRLGDRWYFRNCINAGGYLSFLVGAVQAALNTCDLEYSDLSIRWLALIGCAVTTGIHAMDLYDQAGDSKRGRRTLPIAMGDALARNVLLVSMALVSLSASRVIGVSYASSGPTMALAAVISTRLRRLKPSVRADKATFKFWCLWIISLYLIPVLDKVWFSN